MNPKLNRYVLAGFLKKHPNETSAFLKKLKQFDYKNLASEEKVHRLKDSITTLASIENHDVKLSQDDDELSQDDDELSQDDDSFTKKLFICLQAWADIRLTQVASANSGGEYKSGANNEPMFEAVLLFLSTQKVETLGRKDLTWCRDQLSGVVPNILGPDVPIERPSEAQAALLAKWRLGKVLNQNGGHKSSAPPPLASIMRALASSYSEKKLSNTINELLDKFGIKEQLANLKEHNRECAMWGGSPVNAVHTIENKIKCLREDLPSASPQALKAVFQKTQALSHTSWKNALSAKEKVIMNAAQILLASAPPLQESFIKLNNILVGEEVTPPPEDPDFLRRDISEQKRKTRDTMPLVNKFLQGTQAKLFSNLMKREKFPKAFMQDSSIDQLSSLAQRLAVLHDLDLLNQEKAQWAQAQADLERHNRPSTPLPRGSGNRNLLAPNGLKQHNMKKKLEDSVLALAKANRVPQKCVKSIATFKEFFSGNFDKFEKDRHQVVDLIRKTKYAYNQIKNDPSQSQMCSFYQLQFDSLIKLNTLLVGDEVTLSPEDLKLLTSSDVDDPAALSEVAQCVKSILGPNVFTYIKFTYIKIASLAEQNTSLQCKCKFNALSTQALKLTFPSTAPQATNQSTSPQNQAIVKLLKVLRGETVPMKKSELLLLTEYKQGFIFSRSTYTPLARQIKNALGDKAFLSLLHLNKRLKNRAGDPSILVVFDRDNGVFAQERNINQTENKNDHRRRP